MHRFYVPPEQCGSAEILLTGGEAHQALHVLRIRRGEPVIVLNGAGAELNCEVAACTRDAVHLNVVRRRSVPPPRCRITLAQALPKGKIIESIIQKATELGVSRVVPLLAERSTSRPDDENIGRKGDRWQGVAVEAIKQCGLAWLPKIEPALTPGEFLERQEEFELALIASLRPGSRDARQCFDSFQRERRRAPYSICVWIGPEGDFTPDEAGAAEARGALPVTLGPLVLRVETAAVYCLSVVNHELQSRSAAPASE